MASEARVSGVPCLVKICLKSDGKPIKFLTGVAEMILRGLPYYTILYGRNFSFCKLICNSIEDATKVIKALNRRNVQIPNVKEEYQVFAEFMEDKPKASPPVDASQPPTSVSSFDTNCVKIEVTQKGAECSHSSELQNACILDFIVSFLSVSAEKSVTGKGGDLLIQLQSTEDAKEVIRVMNGFKYSQTSVWFDEKSNAFVKRDIQFQVSAAPIVSIDSQ